jgi:hypothetical protein
MRTIWFAVILVALAVTSGACSTPPKADINAANAAVDKAVAAKASQYAPESLKAAQDARAKMDAELKVQDDHLPMMRSYGEAVKLADAAKAAGEKAEQDAAKAEQMAMSEASTLVVDAKATIQDAEAELGKAPKGKRASADLDVMKSDLAAAKSTVGEAETALASQRYPDAKAKAQAAKATAGSIVSSLQRAHEVQQTARTRRR